MGSRKEEERNEKIIRGLMKLPPNRRCINCNHLGPQYVCINFWTFVCTTCSGIHREFTHRVKSVSMSKFTSQEVEALENGGNQRAREIYLKDWDLQRQRFPDSSKVDKIREFIRSVYVDRKYAGGRTSEKPPRDMQNHRIREDETRRASSYHSYSQSPPYDYQYEDRRYGKQAAALTRKPGSDRGRYEGKLSSFGYSADRLSEQMYEDRFANDGSGSRVSDYSVSSGGDAFRSGVQSPNFQKDIGSSSPSFQPSQDDSDVRCQAKSTVLEANVNRDAGVVPFSQRTISSGSFGSVDSYSMSLKSFNSGGLTDAVSEPEQYAGAVQDKPTSLSSLFGTSDSLDLFKTPVQPEEISSAASSIDLFQLPAASSSLSLDSFQPAVLSSATSSNVYQPPQTSTPLDLFADFPQHLSTSKQVQESVPRSEGWATFDTPQPPASISGTDNIIPANITSSDGASIGNFDLFSSSNTGMQWPSFVNISNPWTDNLHEFTAPNTTASPQSWNAFEDSVGHLPLEGTKKSSESVATDELLSAGDQYLGIIISEDSSTDGIQRAASQGEPCDPGLPSHVLGPSYTPQVLPHMGEINSHASDYRSNNPFDLPYDTDLEQTNMFLDMSSLQASLPNAQLQSSFLSGVSQPWFPEGGLTYLPGQAQSTQIQNVSTQGPVASIGGNPFA
ncbi:putative Arf GTPase activating protein [Rosa chinensis]|uniref:Putative Arf GTPase activating protein n=1 Tax=Rosa chinensis TaxID=74649 RepID=A0A2P6RH99_ROSCH|nr:probable ADP-ribosylation factor GTPase-activating protein AGD14 [Rosa chinensis]PRQ45804.1 putative Arf GTPase activating protein [Rosa chinensis]